MSEDPITDTASGLDIQGILRRLPHRYPFLLVDRVVELSREHIVALKNVSVNEPQFTGHFPGKPIMPGVLQIEAMAQAAGILMLHVIGQENKLALFMSCDKVKFRRMVVPGDQVLIRANLLRTRGVKMGVAGVTCEVEGATVSSADLTFSLIDND